MVELQEMTHSSRLEKLFHIRQQNVLCFLFLTTLRVESNFLPRIEEVGAILIGFLHVFFHTDYPILHNLFELCPFMRTVQPHEDHLEGFLSSYPVHQNKQFLHHFCPIRITLF